MKILVYTASRWQVSTRRMLSIIIKTFKHVEAEVLTCPTLTHETFPYERMAEADMLYFRLHGLENQPFLYGEGHRPRSTQTAFSIELFRESGVELNCQVFLEGCYNALTGVPEAFVQAGAKEVIAAKTQTWNSRFSIGSAAKIGIAAVTAWLDPSPSPAIKEVWLANSKDKRHRVKFARFGGHRR